MRHPDLADPVEIDVFSAIQLGQDCGNFPHLIGIALADNRLLRVLRCWKRFGHSGKNEQEQGAVATQ